MQRSTHPLLRHSIPLVAILLALIPARLDAGAWTQAAGGLYCKIAGLSLRSPEYLDHAGDRQPRAPRPSVEELRDRNISAYLEYGLHEHLTLVATLPYKHLAYKKTEVKEFKSAVLDTTITRRHPDEIRSGLADLELRLRWRLLLQPAAVSLALGGKFPLGYDVEQEGNGTPETSGIGLGLSPLDEASATDSKVPLGTGATDIDMRLLVGESLYPFPGYLTSTFGYRKRGGRFSDELFYSFEAGVTYKRLLVKGVVERMHTMGSCGTTGQAGSLIGDQNILKVAPGLIWSLSENLEVGVDLFHVAAGCNTAAGTTYAIGLAFKR